MMKQSTERILTTHVGSLARPHLLDIMKEREHGRPYDADALDREITAAVADRVKQQVDCRHRHRRRRRDEQGQLPRLREGSPRRVRGRHGPVEDGAVVAGRVRHVPRVLHRVLQEVLVGRQPVAAHHLQGPDQLQRVRSCCRSTSTTSRRPCEGLDVADIFMPASGPSGFGRNEYYKTHEEYLHAVAEAMREEYLGHRRGRVHPPGRRPVADRHAGRPGRADRGPTQCSAGPRRGAQPRTARHPARTASVTTRATASTTARGSPTSR